MKKQTPIFRKIFFPLMLLTLAVIFILIFTLFGQGLLATLNQNEKDVLLSQVEARKNYLEGLMVNDWMQIDETVEDIVRMTEAYMAEQHLSAAELDDSSKTVGPLLTDITYDMIEMMRDNRVTGAYVIFNVDQIVDTQVIPNRPGVYVRDPDPASLVSEQNEDLFLKISPKDVLAAISIPTDSEWDIYFRFDGENEQFTDILSIPFRTAYESDGKYAWKDMGHWYIVQDNDRYHDPILTYTVPLILSDGSVIGVVGVDITFNYLKTVLPYTELGFDGNAAYILARYDAPTDCYFNLFGNGNLNGMTPCGADGLHFEETHYVCARSLHLYETNTPFSGDEWQIAAVVRTEFMQSFSKELLVAAAVAIVIALLVGVFVSMMISYRLQKPIAQIANEIASADPRRALQLTPTGIREVDTMSDEIVKLSHDVLESGRKFSKIMEMASVRLAGFQIDRRTNLLFLTDDFFSVFGDVVHQTGMTVAAFEAAMRRYESYVIEQNSTDGMYTFYIPYRNTYRYIRLCIRESAHHCYGLAEDVTREILEKRMLQHERDHDSLTNLYNRRAFRRKMEDVLALPQEQIRYAALIMIDLDDLKYFNDTFGHECGDQYITRAAEAIRSTLPEKAVCARISGDEFNVFLYGYDSKETLAEQVAALQKAVNSASMLLPDGSNQLVHATGGVAYYPEHTDSMETLSKYADYAMYIAKRNTKRAFTVYDPKMFESQDIQLRHSESLTKMLQYNLVHFNLQPIVDVHSGDVFAYEALMRPDVDPFFTVFDVMETARRDGKLGQVEEMTLFKTMETFDGFMSRGEMAPDTHLFVNSIANQCVSVEKGELFVEKYGKYAKQLVLELTEQERVDKEIWALKEHHHRILGGKVALDDYGSGYNSEITLLDISPDYIKLDMSIVRGIHLDKDKQQIVDNIVRYAHDREKLIIAEGVELADEVKTLLALNVDYMQGYFFGMPLSTPQTISEEARRALGL